MSQNFGLWNLAEKTKFWSKIEIPKSKLWRRIVSFDSDSALRLFGCTLKCSLTYRNRYQQQGRQLRLPSFLIFTKLSRTDWEWMITPPSLVFKYGRRWVRTFHIRISPSPNHRRSFHQGGHPIWRRVWIRWWKTVMKKVNMDEIFMKFFWLGK